MSLLQAMVLSWEVMILLSIQSKDLGWDYWETCQSLKYLVAQRNLCLQGHSEEPTEGPKGSVSGKAEVADSLFPQGIKERILTTG